MAPIVFYLCGALSIFIYRFLKKTWCTVKLTQIFQCIVLSLTNTFSCITTSTIIVYITCPTSVLCVQPLPPKLGSLDLSLALESSRHASPFESDLLHLHKLHPGQAGQHFPVFSAEWNNITPLAGCIMSIHPFTCGGRRYFTSLF